jgi:large subunit ribosomal protein L19
MAQKENNKTKEEEKEVTETDTKEVLDNSVEDTQVESEDISDNASSEVSENEEADGDEEELVEENISVELEGVEETVEKDKMFEFRVGDTIRVSYKIIEGDKVRTQPYQGIVIAMKGAGDSKTFTVRKIGADGIGVERIFPFKSPNIENVKLVKRGKVRRAKLYYLRGRVGRKATRIKEKVTPEKK